MRRRCLSSAGRWQVWENVTLGNMLTPLDRSTLKPLYGEQQLLADPALASRIAAGSLKLADWDTNILTDYLNELTQQLLAARWFRSCGGGS